MKLDEVMDEVAAVLEILTGLQVIPHPPMKISPPAGVVSYPESIDYDETYARGTDKINALPIILLVGRATDLHARDTVAAWSAGSGAKSLKRAMEAHAWVSCDDLTVTRCSFDVVRVADVDYLAAMFEADCVGPGTD